MNEEYFRNLYANLALAVVACENTPELPVVYMNVRASLLVSPGDSVERLKGGAAVKTLDDILEFDSPQDSGLFRRALKGTGHVDRHAALVKLFDGQREPAVVSCKVITVDSPGDYAVFFLIGGPPRDVAESDGWLAEAASAILLSDNVEDSIGYILDFAGRQMGVSRAYVFEEISDACTRNTYEWCAPGVTPAIQDLQELQKADYNYDTIAESGMYVTDDVRELPAGDREILEAQGIRSLAILMLYDNEKPIGYVGFDDCVNYRKWSDKEMRFLKTVASLLALVIKRRNAERGIKNSLEMLQLMSDNSDEVVYVNSLSDYKLMFVSKALYESLGKRPEELLGRECWKVLQKDQTGPCAFCPIPKLDYDPEAERSEPYVWERENTITGKSYLIKDNLMKWVDGQSVHVETAIDITDRIEYEENLRYLASMDRMTGVYNREWGANVLEKMLKDPKTSGCLCFLDVDNLKRTNDTYGHNAGDSLLSETARIIKNHLTPGDFVCRWGGDEFLIWISRDEQGTQDVVGAIQREMQAVNETGERQYPLSFSFGTVCCEPGEAATLDALVTQADSRMYDNKMEKLGRMKRRRRGD